VPGLHKPLGTVVAGGSKHALVSAFLSTNTSGHAPSSAEHPIPTLATGNHQILCSAFLSRHFGESVGQSPLEPMPTATGCNKTAEVRAFLIKYYGQGQGQTMVEPLHTVTVKDRLGLVTLHGQDWQIVDIGMRMLTPRELARAHDFPEDYVLTGTKTSQVARIGNSVVVSMAAALVRANYKVQRYQAEEVAV
jgi:DNA (cytosine-5)-methyltransferase 1